MLALQNIKIPHESILNRITYSEFFFRKSALGISNYPVFFDEKKVLTDSRTKAAHHAIRKIGWH
ncbi:MAG TPA: hypothetical protein VI913_05905, partial [Candidatus Peribacteraceae bacterium]|nr:hypothetical protein [Candidatus Peribacteraceae bacterium]